MAGRRKYQDGCPVSLAMDLVGERWALLIVRELLLGPKRFGDLRAGLFGASPDMVTRQLRELTDHGIVRRVRLPAPASAWAYELTPWGRQLEPVVISLARWSVQAAEMAERAGRPLSVDSGVLSLRVLFDPEAAAEADDKLGLTVDEEPFEVTIRRGTLTVERKRSTDADLRIATDPETLAAVVRGSTPLDLALRQGRLRFESPEADERAGRSRLSTILGYFGAD